MNVLAPSMPEQNLPAPHASEHDFDVQDALEPLESAAPVGRHRRTAGRIAYQLARETGDPETIKTASEIARREHGGHHDAQRDARELIRLLTTAPDQTAHHQNAHGYQDPEMTTVFRPTIQEVQQPKDSYAIPSLTTRDFHADAQTPSHPISHVHQLPTGISIPQQRSAQK